ncbi:MAG: phosphotransferase [Salinisphaera sp.]|nr:phosphotransferase [Salinisphaera sp.]
MPGEPANCDLRLDALRGWLQQALPRRELALAPASADASFRRYFRVFDGAQTWVAMDAPPEHEDCRAFVRVAALLTDAGLHAPAVQAQDLERGFLLLEDLGSQTYLEALDESNADVLFADALDALVAWQRATRPGVLPDYDPHTLQRELELFETWFLGRYIGVQLEHAERQIWRNACGALVARACAAPRVFVHRDYMPRNLMVSAPNPGVLDFQDARFGPITYDLISLFKDAFTSWPELRVESWLADYRQRASAAGLPVPAGLAALRADCDWMGAQRHLKVLGIFARIRYRDGKPAYLDDAPRFVAYLRPVLARYPELAGLARLFARHVDPVCPP